MTYFVLSSLAFALRMVIALSSFGLREKSQPGLSSHSFRVTGDGRRSTAILCHFRPHPLHTIARQSALPPEGRVQLSHRLPRAVRRGAAIYRRPGYPPLRVVREDCATLHPGSLAGAWPARSGRPLDTTPQAPSREGSGPESTRIWRSILEQHSGHGRNGACGRRGGNTTSGFQTSLWCTDTSLARSRSHLET